MGRVGGRRSAGAKRGKGLVTMLALAQVLLCQRRYTTAFDPSGYPAIDRTKEQGAVLIYIFFAVGVAVGVDMLGTYSNCLGHSLSSGTPSFGWA